MRTDTLSDIISEIQGAVTAEGLSVFPCENLESIWYGGDEGQGQVAELRLTSTPVLEWDHDCGGYKAFLSSGKALGAKVIYMRAKRFSWERDLYRALEREENVSEIDRAELKSNAQFYRGYDGFVEYIILAFMQNGVWHTYQETADWYRAYGDLLGDRAA